MKKQEIIEKLQKRGLSKKEAKAFYKALKNLTPTKKDLVKLENKTEDFSENLFNCLTQTSVAFQKRKKTIIRANAAGPISEIPVV